MNPDISTASGQFQYRRTQNLIADIIKNCHSSPTFSSFSRINGFLILFSKVFNILSREKSSSSGNYFPLFPAYCSTKSLRKCSYLLFTFYHSKPSQSVCEEQKRTTPRSSSTSLSVQFTLFCVEFKSIFTFFFAAVFFHSTYM